jgi:hypothetical protein
MAQLLDLGKLRFYFAGEWSNSTTYEINDIVKYGGNIYVYTYGLKTSGNLPTDTTYWQLMVEGFKFEGVYDNTAAYQVADGVTHGGKVYICIKDTVGNTPPNSEFWSQFADGIQWEDVYNSLTSYQKNDIVTYGGSVYIALQDTTNNLPSDTSFWQKFVEGIHVEGVYNTAKSYVFGDVVGYGGNLYRALGDTTNNPPTNATYWEVYLEGTSAQADYDNLAVYHPNDVVYYGGTLYRAIATTSAGDLPTDTNLWSVFQHGINPKGDWSNNVAYAPGDVASYGGNTFKCLVAHASNVFAADLASAYWEKFNGGIDYKGEWQTSSFYKVDDVVKDGISTYICLEDHTGGVFATDVAANKWEYFARGASDVLPVISAGDEGKSLTVAADGINYTWISATGSNNVFYVAPHGTDVPNAGKALATPFASIKYATEQAPSNSVIYVSNGTYNEQLPITVPDTVAIIGDSQRSVIVQPDTVTDNGNGAGISSDGVTPNNELEMFRLSNGSYLKGMTFKGMTGWVPAASPNQGNIALSTPKGVAVCLNPSSPVTTKSPYVVECSAIGSGMVGAYVNGDSHASGNQSMLFHAYTVISDNGVGFWIANGARAEIVSCFTYYCYFGYAADHGAQIRALNGNNSYGTYGAVSLGFDQDETPLVGQISGVMLTTSTFQGTISEGDTLTGSTSGATAVVTSNQASAGRLFVVDVTGTFQSGETISNGTGGSAVMTQTGTADQTGFIVVVDNLASNPVPGRSIAFAGDSTTYVIQSVSGTYVDASSNIILVLAQEKATTSPDDAQVTIREKFSQIRLTGHDFLKIGTGGIATTNYPGDPTQAPAPGNETVETFPGRIYYVSTDQDGNFRVGEYFRIEQSTGKATLNASAFDLAGLTSLRLGSIGAQLGEQINEFSSDVTMSGNSNIAVPTEYAVKTYADNAGTKPAKITFIGTF